MTTKDLLRLQEVMNDYNGKLLLCLIAKLCICEHMGDVADEIDIALEELKLNIKWDDLSDLSDEFIEAGVVSYD